MTETVKVILDVDDMKIALILRITAVTITLLVCKFSTAQPRVMCNFSEKFILKFICQLTFQDPVLETKPTMVVAQVTINVVRMKGNAIMMETVKMV